MQTFVGLLRGINVGGHKKVPMADLRRILGAIGLKSIRTYIQSGNTVFESTKTTAELKSVIEKAIEKEFGFAVPVIVIKKSMLVEIASNYPFPTDEPKFAHIMFLGGRVSAERIEQIGPMALEPDRMEFSGNALFFHFPNGVSGAKSDLTKLEKTLGVPTTTRNWRTVQKLIEL